jgi:cytoskeleton protein RodZ
MRAITARCCRIASINRSEHGAAILVFGEPSIRRYILVAGGSSGIHPIGIRRTMVSKRIRHLSSGGDPGLDLPSRIGHQLQEARLARGEDLRDVADILRIRLAYLEALERGDHDLIPGHAYVHGFLRSYANYLDLNGADLADGLLDGEPAQGIRPALVYRLPIAEPRRATGYMLALSILAAAGFYSFWYVHPAAEWRVAPIASLPSSVERSLADLVAGEPLAGSSNDPPQSGAPAPAVTTANVDDPIPTLDELRLEAPEPTILVAQVPSAPESGAASAQAAEALPSSAGQMLASLQPGDPSAPPTTSGAAPERVVLIARETSWVQVRSASRDFVRTRTLEPGDQMALPDRADLALWTGNGGGVEIWVDGRNTGVVGRSGQVVRDLPLTPDARLANRAANQ